MSYYNPGSELLQGGGRVVSARALPSEKVMADQINVGTVFIEEGDAFTRLLEGRERAVFEWLEISQESQWLRAGSKNPRRGMDLLRSGSNQSERLWF